jgi:hypothetical protein
MAKAVKGKRGLKPGTKFGKQAHVLAGVYRDKKLSAEVDGEKFTPDIIDALAVAQTADEDEETKLFNAYQDHHLAMADRAITRATTFSKALEAARGLLKKDKAAMETLKEAAFNSGGSKKKKEEPKK